MWSTGVLSTNLWLLQIRSVKSKKARTVNFMWMFLTSMGLVHVYQIYTPLCITSIGSPVCGCNGGHLKKE